MPVDISESQASSTLVHAVDWRPILGVYITIVTTDTRRDPQADKFISSNCSELNLASIYAHLFDACRYWASHSEVAILSHDDNEVS